MMGYPYLDFIIHTDSKFRYVHDISHKAHVHICERPAEWETPQR